VGLATIRGETSDGEGSMTLRAVHVTSEADRNGVNEGNRSSNANTASDAGIEAGAGIVVSKEMNRSQGQNKSAVIDWRKRRMFVGQVDGHVTTSDLPASQTLRIKQRYRWKLLNIVYACSSR
jgi:hypothetical protein